MITFHLFNRCVQIDRLSFSPKHRFLHGGGHTEWPWWQVRIGRIDIIVGRVRPRTLAFANKAGIQHEPHTMRRRSIARDFWTAVAFLTLVVGANWLTATYGLIPVGLGLAATAGTWCAGLVLVARDVVQDLSGRAAVVALIAAGGGLSAILAAPQLAVASAVAFAVSEVADLAVYTPLRRKGWGRAAFLSGLVGSAVDTVLFLALAGFPIGSAMPGQMFAKTAATVAVVTPVVVARALLRNRLRPESA